MGFPREQAIAALKRSEDGGATWSKQYSWAVPPVPTATGVDMDRGVDTDNDVNTDRDMDLDLDTWTLSCDIPDQAGGGAMR